MTQQEWENASEEERNAEYERCKDPVYFYNTYYTLPDGSKPNPITKSDWDELLDYANNYQYYKNRRYRPIY